MKFNLQIELENENCCKGCPLVEQQYPEKHCFCILYNEWIGEDSDSNLVRLDECKEENKTITE